MFIAMNRFRVTKGREAEFERVWAERDTYLERVPGFRKFHLLKGTGADGHTLYSSHTVWRDRQAFLDWTESEAFRKAHARAETRDKLYLGRPQFEGFEVVLES